MWDEYWVFKILLKKLEKSIAKIKNREYNVYNIQVRTINTS